MDGHDVLICGGGPTGLMLAGELALAGVDAAIVERRADRNLPGRRAGGFHSRTIEVLDQRGIADRFLSQGKPMQITGFNMVPLDMADFPTRHPYGLALTQNHMERILGEWVDGFPVKIYGRHEVAGAVDAGPWADRVRLLDARYDGAWELPVLGMVPAPSAVLIRPDGYAAWVGDGGRSGLAEAMTRWFGDMDTETIDNHGR